MVAAFSVWGEGYHVGPRMEFAGISEVRWDSLAAGDTVFIHYRDSSYHEKWVICRAGTETQPIVVKGVPGVSGRLPVIDGRNATTPSFLNFWNEERGVIKIGGANSPPDTLPAYIIIESLEIKSARPPYSFTGRYGAGDYVNNCSAIYVEKGEHIIIRNCIFHDCGNGFFCGHQTTDLVLEGNYIYGNGMEGRFYEHNTYTEAYGILFQFNHFGPLREGCGGNNLKDRSAGAVIRYNWIENGNRQLDLVESDYEEFYTDTIYRSTFVYGNILVEGEGEGNSQIIHYGGDNGYEPYYRKGTLFLYNNTIISTRLNNTTLVRLSTSEESCDARNNIIYSTAAGSYLAMLDETGTIDLRNNWLKSGWVNCHGYLAGAVNDYGNLEGTEPGFSDFGTQDFSLADGSPCIDSGTILAPETLPDNLPVMHYIRHCLSATRPNDSAIDIGAFEYSAGHIIREEPSPCFYEILCFPNPFNSSCYISGPINASYEIYDINGRIISEINRGKRIWKPGSSIESGVYFIMANAGNKWYQTKKVIYLK